MIQSRLPPLIDARRSMLSVDHWTGVVVHWAIPTYVSIDIYIYIYRFTTCEHHVVRFPIDNSLMVMSLLLSVWLVWKPEPFFNGEWAPAGASRSKHDLNGENNVVSQLVARPWSKVIGIFPPLRQTLLLFSFRVWLAGTLDASYNLQQQQVHLDNILLFTIILRAIRQALGNISLRHRLSSQSLDGATTTFILLSPGTTISSNEVPESWAL